MTIRVSGVDTLIEIAEAEGWTIDYDEDANTFNIVDNENSNVWVFDRDGLFTTDSLEATSASVSAVPTTDTDVVRKVELDSVESDLSDHESTVSDIHGVGSDDSVAAVSEVDAVDSSLGDHESDTTNPHNVTNSQVDAPSVTEFEGHSTDTDNPHNVTNSQVDAPSVSEFEGHSTDTTNPHEVDYTQTGGAASDHDHTYSSITNREHGSEDHDTSVVEDGDDEGKSLHIVNAGQFDASNFDDTDIIFERE